MRARRLNASAPRWRVDTGDLALAGPKAPDCALRPSGDSATGSGDDPPLGTTLAALGPSNPLYWHYLVEAKKLAYSDLLAKNGDPKFAQVPVKELLSKSHAASLCAAIESSTAAGNGCSGARR